MTLLEKISFLMDENNLNKRQLSLQIGLSYSTVDNLWKRNTDSMRLPTFIKICHFFNVTMESMAYDELDIAYKPTGPADPVVLSDGENILVEKYRDMNDKGKTKLQERASELVILENKKGSADSLEKVG